MRKTPKSKRKVKSAKAGKKFTLFNLPFNTSIQVIAILIAFLTIPLVLFIAQQTQDLNRSAAAYPAPTPARSPAPTPALCIVYPACGTYDTGCTTYLTSGGYTCSTQCPTSSVKCLQSIVQSNYMFSCCAYALQTPFITSISTFCEPGPGIHIAWSKVSGANDYIISRCERDALQLCKVPFKFFANTSGLEYWDRNVRSNYGITYQYTLQAHNTVKKTYSPISGPKSIVGPYCTIH